MMYRLCWLTLLAILTVALTGCTGNQQDEGPSGTTAVNSPVQMDVLIVDDSSLGPVIERQFSSRRNGQATVTEMTWEALSEEEFASVTENDLVIYPHYRIGDLAHRDLLLSLSRDNYRSELTQRRSVLYFDQERAVSWGAEQVALSLGQSHWVMLCRQDVLKQLEREVPSTWEEFDRLVEALEERELPEDLPTKIGFPLAGHWASYSLMVRVASAIRVPGTYSTFFNVDSMEPLLETEPFLNSLRAMQLQLPGTSEMEPREVLAAFARGELAVAIVPVNHHWWPEGSNDELPPMQLAGVPGWSSVYDPERQLWSERTGDATLAVPLVGSTGMLISATTRKKRQRNAIDVMSWLTNKSISSVISTESPNTGLSRKSHLGKPGQWLGQSISRENALAFVDYMNQVNEQRRMLVTLRIPQADRYLDVLDQGVRKVVIEDANAVEALAGVAKRWSELNDEIGFESQRQAYRNSVGIEY